jgi:K+/H+ antiporter YhaU regulatory subunit KhtT
MILGLERDGYATAMPDANMLIEKGDILWIIGTAANLSSIAAHSVGDTGTHSARPSEAESAEKGKTE